MDKQYLIHNDKEEATINIQGHEVLIVKRTVGIDIDPFFCAYVELKGQSIFSDRFLGHPTYRKGDVVGIDTAHSFNETQTELQKFKSAISQITRVIEAYNTATKESEDE